jgi:citrate lyase subunit beta/citryl-CoA lyase
MTSRMLPLWRSLMFCPASEERFIAKAHTRGADAVILDLEDSVAFGKKADARAAIPDAARRIKAGGPDVLVRINRELDLAVADIAASVVTDVAALVLPKIKGPEHVQLISELIAAREMQSGIPLGQIKLLPLIESTAALAQANAIAASDPRVVGLAVGGEDLATDMEAEPTVDSLYVAKMLGLYAARAAGILPIGVLASVANVEDLATYRSMLERSRKLGFAGATCVHPSHVAFLNAAFSPTPAEIERAQRLIAAFEAVYGDKTGEQAGAILFEGNMIDRPVMLRAKRIVQRAKE